MMQNTRKTWYWAGGATAAVVVVLFALWAAGMFSAAPAQ